MKKILVASILGAALLASCNQASVSGKTKTTDFAAPATAVAGYTVQAGKAAISELNTNDTVTILTATGLKANTSYVAHYHAQGTGVNATKPPCESGGAIVDGMIGMAMNSAADGSLTLKGFTPTANLKDAKYINIHEAAALGVVPLCADLKK
jgi:superoxide dismutase, Cu-Zn family